MRVLLTFFLFLQLSVAFAALTVTDKEKLATVTLHTELLNSSKRVYLAADFEASHTSGLIACEITVEHKNGKANGPVFKLVEDTTLLPNEKIPFNLGLFPERFHASGLDVKANLICRKVPFFNQKPLLKATEKTVGYCCRISPLKIICATEPSDEIYVNATEVQSTVAPEGDWPSCWPGQSG